MAETDDDTRSLVRLAEFLVHDQDTASQVVRDVLAAGPPDIQSARMMVTGRCRDIARQRQLDS